MTAEFGVDLERAGDAANELFMIAEAVTKPASVLTTHEGLKISNDNDAAIAAEHAYSEFTDQLGTWQRLAAINI